MEKLFERGTDVHVITSGNGVAFFADKPFVKTLNAVEPFFYSSKDSGVNGWDTVKSLKKLLRIARNKSSRIDELVARLRPDVAVIDSEYTIGPLRKRKIPVIGLNTSEIVVSEYLKHRHVPSSIRSHFWFVEFSDYLFHKYFCDVVLSPYPVASPTRARKFRRTGLILRPAVRQLARQHGDSPFPEPRAVRRVVFMLSGSIHASQISFQGREIPFAIDVVGRHGSSHGPVTFHGRQLNNVEFLRRADAIVINGGYSAVSEAFALGKPAFIVPVQGHAEQFVNAKLAERFGIGAIATENDVLDQLLGAYAANRWPKWNARPASFEFDGADEAADVFTNIIMSKRGALSSAPPEVVSASREP